MEDVKKITDDLNKSFKKIMKLNGELLNKLNDEQRKQVMPMQNDINAILNAVKNGDILAINEIQKRYADTNIQ